MRIYPLTNTEQPLGDVSILHEDDEAVCHSSSTGSLGSRFVVYSERHAAGGL